jgi:DNA-directed RNA polymerase subunit alpha
VPGTATDVTSLIKNLKKIRFNVLDVEDTEVKTIHFKHNKKGFVTAGELALPAGIEVQNPEQNLINLLGSEEVEFEIYVKRGRGYVDAKLHKEFEGRPDIIKVDGTFSPVKLVGYEVENMRLGQDATYERLILNVTTDGSINAKDATLVAAKIAYDHFSFFEGISDIATKTEIYQEKMEVEENHILDQPIEILDLSVRSFNCLKREKRLFIRDIIALTEMELYNIHQLGDKSVKEIIVKIKELGLEMKAE